MSSDSWLSLTDSPFNCCCKCPTAWGKSRAGMNQSWSSSSSISWKQRSKKSCSCSSSSTYQQRGKTKRNYSRAWSLWGPQHFSSEVLTQNHGRKANEKCSQLVHVYKYLVPSWWCCSGTSQNLYEVESWGRKYVSGGRLWDLRISFYFYFFLSASNLR